MISIIVPIFHGKRYIHGMITQIEKCMDYVKNEILELIIVNDDNEEPLDEEYNSAQLSIQIIQTNCNRGIHGARAYGLRFARGEIIHFLDQDDRITPYFYREMLSEMKDYDAVVCNAIHNGQEYYGNYIKLSDVKNKEAVIRKGNQIISPGQVLIKKNAIPEVWTKVQVKKSGLDDWLLWICMNYSDKKFTYTDKILFEHVQEYSNTSNNVIRMMESRKEVYQIIQKQEILGERELAILREYVESTTIKEIKILEKYRKMFFVLNDWMKLLEEEKNIAMSLQKEGIHRVAIYGMSFIGNHLAIQLQNGGIEVAFGIDRNINNSTSGIPIITPSEPWKDIDAVIMTPFEDNEELSRFVDNKTSAKKIWIAELIFQLLNE